MKRFFYILLLAVPMMAWSKPVLVSPRDSLLRYVGRMTFRGGYAEYALSGWQVRASFTGHSIAMKMKPNSGYYMVQLDELEPYKIQSGEDSLMWVGRDLEGEEHDLIVTYLNEGQQRPRFYGLVLEEGAELMPTYELPERRLEFIGNSITNGVGIEATEGRAKATTANQNHFYTFEAIACRALNAQCQVFARSGNGAYRIYGGKVTGDKGVVPDLYPYTLGGLGGEKWDFSKYVPDVICLNLGTNDTSTPGYDVTLMYNGFWRFYKEIRELNPTSKIVLVTGSMLSKGSKRLLDVQSCMDRVVARAKEAGDEEVYRFDFTPEDGSMGWGGLYHPNLKRHAYMAEELIPFLREITGWE